LYTALNENLATEILDQIKTEATRLIWKKARTAVRCTTRHI